VQIAVFSAEDFTLQECRQSVSAVDFGHPEPVGPAAPLFSGNKFSVESGQKQSSMSQEELNT
jgi:hypothetical protein